MRHARLRVTHVRGLSTTAGHRVPERKLIFPGSRLTARHRRRFSRLAGSSDVLQACNSPIPYAGFCLLQIYSELPGIIKNR